MNEQPAALPLKGIVGLLFALLLALASSAAFQGSRGLWESTEGRYAECARQMDAEGSYLTPVLNGAGHWTKPPLTYWGIIAGCKLLGWNAWGARAYLVAAFLISVAAVYFTGEELWGQGNGGICAAVYATSPYVFAGASSVSTDMLLAMWIALIGMFFWRGLRRRSGREFAFMWVSVAGAVMTKGPAGVLVLAGIIPTYIFARRRDPALPPLMTLASGVLFATLAFGWYLLEIARHTELIRYWLGTELIGRNITSDAGRNPEWYKAFMYIPALTFGSGFWVLLLLMKARHIPRPAGPWTRPLRWERGLEWTWIILSIVPALLVFMLIKSRLYLYVLPLMAPVALAIGAGIGHLVERRHLERGLVTRVALLCALGLVSAKAYLTYKVDSPRDMRVMGEKLAPQIGSFPNERLYLVGGQPLYGLQFYLRREFGDLPSLEPPVTREVSAVLEKNLLDDAAAGRTSLILARVKDFEEVSEAIWGIRHRNIYAPRLRVLVRAGTHEEFGFLAVQPQLHNANFMGTR